MITKDTCFHNRERLDTLREIFQAYQPGEQTERAIRLREREMVAWIKQDPAVRAGKRLREVIAYSRRIHTQSIARSRSAA